MSTPENRDSRPITDEVNDEGKQNIQSTQNSVPENNGSPVSGDSGAMPDFMQKFKESIQKLNGMKTILQEKTQQNTQFSATVLTQLQQIQSLIQQISQRMNQIKAKTQELQSQISDNANKMQQHEQTIQQHSSENADLQSQINSLRAQLENLQSQLTSANAEKEASEARLSGNAAQAQKECEQRISDLEKQIQSNNAEIASHQNDKQGLNSQNAQLQQYVQEMNSQIESLIDELNGIINAYEPTNPAILETLTNINAQLTQLLETNNQEGMNAAAPSNVDNTVKVNVPANLPANAPFDMNMVTVTYQGKNYNLEDILSKLCKPTKGPLCDELLQYTNPLMSRDFTVIPSLEAFLTTNSDAIFQGLQTITGGKKYGKTHKKHRKTSKRKTKKQKKQKGGFTYNEKTKRTALTNMSTLSQSSKKRSKGTKKNTSIPKTVSQRTRSQK